MSTEYQDHCNANYGPEDEPMGRCEYCGQEARYGHNAVCVMNEVIELRARNDELSQGIAELERRLEPSYLNGELASLRDRNDLLGLMIQDVLVSVREVCGEQSQIAVVEHAKRMNRARENNAEIDELARVLYIQERAP